jgi:hypothetical protein
MVKRALAVLTARDTQPAQSEIAKEP